ncbi:hypothetical protein CYMTET_19104 [Cymbomonas tetramitiformis]|uniref:Uncharacterized protein n=1 Tax=Cymbomonas tetramitiformis TaxID=36881 RepID=A0AAE0L578_9CHLO|nr:hypothetical protein CYMTET_19104 [Cymbomonas tetramitiformis]
MGCRGSIPEKPELELSDIPWEIKEISKQVIEWRESGKKIWEVPIGVNLSFLEKFFNRYRVHDRTTEEVVDEFIRPATEGQTCSYLDLFSLQGETTNVSSLHGGTIGEATHFVSHAWSGKFRDLVSALRTFSSTEGKARKRIYFYLDIFALSQHLHPKEYETSVEEVLSLAIRNTGKTLLVASPWPSPVAFRRLWCLYELFATVMAGSDLILCFPFAELKRMETASVETLASFLHAIGSIDSKLAETSLREDHSELTQLLKDASLEGHEQTCNQTITRRDSD